MSCSSKRGNCNNDHEVIVGNTTFNYELREVSDNAYDLVVTPCNVPTSIYCVARITRRENCCNNMSYYQSFVNTDPVQIIQDCSLEDIIARSIEAYFDNNSFGGNNGCCRNNGCNLF